MKEPDLKILLTNKKKIDTEYLLLYIAIELVEIKRYLHKLFLTS